jgi:hypothetical protein
MPTSQQLEEILALLGMLQETQLHYSMYQETQTIHLLRQWHLLLLLRQLHR